MQGEGRSDDRSAKRTAGDSSTTILAMGSAPTISFEFFPPKTPEMSSQLWKAVHRLAPLQPSHVSITYGAGGSTRERTFDLVRRTLAETELTPAAHLTCVEATRAEVDEVIRTYWAMGVRHIVALRGDPPDQLGGSYEPGPQSYRNATELVAAITRIAPFEVTVGAYPEKHPESASIAFDIEVLKAKVDAGATRATTQFFLDTTQFFRFVDAVRAAGIDIPIVPGIMPVTSVKGLQRMAQVSHARIPKAVQRLFEGLDADPQTRNLVSASAASEMCRTLIDQGFEALHFYTMNRAELVYAVCRMLGVRESFATTGDEASPAREAAA